MKKITLLLLLTFSLSYSQTTVEEYNYVTKGYAETISKGLDLKKGYSLTEVYHYTDSNYDFLFQSLTNDRTKKTSCIMVIAHSLGWGNRYYLCIPIGDSQLEEKYKYQLNLWDAPILSAYSLALSQILTYSLMSAE
ncbi:hypothetical protein D0817_19225 [Flavobacterium cupreum]|uniref:Uncharacterized protein n=2 Tax=Flavobacterium TaxID=237 RepID=A0A4Y7UBE6_9FLAO|nr:MULTISPECIES: hypothetical protein [Flavobacterium]RUT68749.1 hypothetical protein D0817_19225 [Flavobacterium cupreum]TCN55488.1 hypothetical protein EV142_106177 [Flavobacterium circumlabens]TEB43102.1 hypothetical protein D0809_16845 [Flavobacterium circumlabens]